MKAANAITKVNNTDKKNHSFHNLIAENLIKIKASIVATIIVMNNGIKDVCSSS